MRSSSAHRISRRFKFWVNDNEISYTSLVQEAGVDLDHLVRKVRVKARNILTFWRVALIQLSQLCVVKVHPRG
jgi:hypothetical protein